MKKIIFALTLSIFSFFSFAQSNNEQSQTDTPQVTKKICDIKTTQSPDGGNIIYDCCQLCCNVACTGC